MLGLGKNNGGKSLFPNCSKLRLCGRALYTNIFSSVFFQIVFVHRCVIRRWEFVVFKGERGVTLPTTRERGVRQP